MKPYKSLMSQILILLIYTFDSTFPRPFGIVLLFYFYFKNAYFSLFLQLQNQIIVVSYYY